MAKLDLNKEISLGGSSGKIPRNKVPTKTSINLVPQKESFLKSKDGLRKLILCMILAILLLVFFVIMPLVRLSSANARIKDLRAQLDEANQTIESHGNIEEEYAHYTTDGMTAEELSRVDRDKVMRLVEKSVVSSGAVNGWEITGNVMTLNVSGSSLAELNQIAAALEKESLVDRCVINTADKGSTKDNGMVAVSFIVYLNEEGAEK
ncbi:MAG: hypothetical protein IJH62_09480 [Mogibacterium sp.]|nr:hypothetical protein [Mogibacterium sp.]